MLIMMLFYNMNLELMNSKNYFIFPDRFHFRKPSESKGKYIEIKKDLL